MTDGKAPDSLSILQIPVKGRKILEISPADGYSRLKSALDRVIITLSFEPYQRMFDNY